MAEQLIQPMQDAIRELREWITALKLALAESAAKLAEVRAKADTTDAVVSRLRLDHKGDPGPPGPMGRDGRDGAQGPRGEKGSRGQRGQEIPGWRLDTANFLATPVFYDNSEGPPISLRPFFEAYDAAVQEDYFDESARATADAHDQIEREAARLRLGLPKLIG
jgi:hypothetical protein